MRWMGYSDWHRRHHGGRHQESMVAAAQVLINRTELFSGVELVQDEIWFSAWFKIADEGWFQWQSSWWKIPMEWFPLSTFVFGVLSRIIHFPYFLYFWVKWTIVLWSDEPLFYEDSLCLRCFIQSLSGSFNSTQLLGGVPETAYSTRNMIKLQNKKIFVPSSIGFNSGVLIMNLKRMRDVNFGEDLLLEANKKLYPEWNNPNKVTLCWFVHRLKYIPSLLNMSSMNIRWNACGIHLL